VRRPSLPVLLLVPVLAVSFGFHAYFAAHPTTHYQSADERSYGRLAVLIADEHEYGTSTTSLHWPPGAPFFFAAAHELFPSRGSATSYDIPAAYWFQAVLSLGTALAAFGLAWAVAGSWAGLAAAALVASYPPLILATGEQLSEPLGAFFLTAGLCAFALAARSGRWWAYGGSGVVLGLAVLTRADLLPIPFLLAAFALLVLLLRRRWRRGLAVAALVGGGTALALAPWTIYASHRDGGLVPVTTGSSSALFVGTYLPGGGTTVGMKRALGAEAKRQNPNLRKYADFDLPAASVLRVVARKHPHLAFEDAVAAEGRRNLVHYVTHRPVAFARMMLDKGVMRMWSRYARGGARHTSWEIRVWHIVLVLASLVGILGGLRRRRDAALAAVLIAALTSTAIHMIVVSQARYNLPLMPALLAAGAGGWALVIAARRRTAAPGAPPSQPVPPGEPVPAG
jgi:4-amino-4-deoxy-L-arabinose transferase-like glycosyltransferase